MFHFPKPGCEPVGVSQARGAATRSDDWRLRDVGHSLAARLGLFAALAAGMACSSTERDGASSVTTDDSGVRDGQAADSRVQSGELAKALGQALPSACPLSDAADADARSRCADALRDLGLLRENFKPILRWGAQKVAGDYDPAKSNTTEFDPFVYRRLYLSTFAFSDEYRVEEQGPRTVLRIGVQFRHSLDPGDYPYPFWHSAAKWQSYLHAEELLFIFEGGQIVSVLRSAEQDPDRPDVERTWDGQWVWTSDRGEEPRAALYKSILSADNPFLADLERAYRDFEAAQREQSCTGCHSLSNPAGMNPLELFSYPNQALSGRRDIVTQLKQNTMPPAAAAAPAGIADKAYRERLLKLATEFADTGDKALAFEDALP